MAQKRPSTVSIRKRQRNIVEGMGTVPHMKYADAAKRLGVTPAQLRSFLDRTPTTRRNFNRSPAYRKLYEAGERKSVAQSFGVKRVNRYPHKAAEIRDLAAKQEKYPKMGYGHPDSKQVSHLLIKYYYPNGHEETAWATWTREHDLPISINAIRDLRKNDEITANQYHSALVTWRETYTGIKDGWYAKYAEYDNVEDYTDAAYGD